MSLFFGPVSSRRLGRSLGLDILPEKICSMDCLYCEIGRSRSTTCRRGEYLPLKQIHDSIDREVADRDQKGWDDVDVVTVTASGEPTLHSGLGEIIAHIKQSVPKPVALLTNGSLCHLAVVRQDIAACDMIIPSLDAARDDTFQTINRPDAGVDLSRVIQGLSELVRQCPGAVYLEILFGEKINDSTDDLEALAEALRTINPHRVQIHTVSRPPAYASIAPVPDSQLNEITSLFQTILPGKIDCYTRKKTIPDTQARYGDRHPDEERVIELLKRRPSTLEDIVYGLNTPPQETGTLLQTLHQQKKIRTQKKNNEIFYFIGHFGH